MREITIEIITLLLSLKVKDITHDPVFVITRKMKLNIERECNSFLIENLSVSSSNNQQLISFQTIFNNLRYNLLFFNYIKTLISKIDTRIEVASRISDPTFIIKFPPSDFLKEVKPISELIS